LKSEAPVRLASSSNNGFNGEFEHRCAGCAGCADEEISLASSTVEFLAADHAHLILYSARHKRELPDGPKPAQCRSAMVCFPSTCPFSNKPRKRTLTLFPYRYFPYWIAVAALSIIYLALMLWLISQRSLLPGIVILGAFILFVLWLVGLIVTSIEFWGPTGNVNTECNIFVIGQNTNGATIETLAWLEQHSICKFLAFLRLLFCDSFLAFIVLLCFFFGIG
jgi:hypothetical protein